MFFCVGNLFSQNTSKASLFGNIRDKAGQALEGVTVILVDKNKGVVTNAKGFYHLKNISEGRHNIKVSYLGFESFQKEIEFGPKAQIQLDIQLEESSFELETINLKGKSAVRKINEQAYTVNSVSTKALQNSTSDAKQILNRVPGVRILQDGGLGSDLDFSLNGFSGDQVKFFLNGIPMDNFGSAFNLASIPVNSIERIDVYKGVVPVWLGTDALGGAVNIITNQKNDFLDVSYSYGSFNTHRTSVNGAFTNKNGFTVRGNFNHNYSDNNYDVLVDKKDVNGNVVERNIWAERFHDRYRSISANIETGWVNTDFADQLLFGIIASGDDNQIQTGATMETVYGGVINESESVIPTLKYKKNNLFFEGLDVSLNSALNLVKNKIIDTLTGRRFDWSGNALDTGSETDGELGEASLLTLDNTEFTSQFNASYLFDEKHSLVFNHGFQYFHQERFDVLNPDRIANQFPNSLYKNVLGLAYKYNFNQNWNATAFGKAYILNLETSKEFDFGEETRRTDVFETNSQNFGYGLATSYFILPNLQLKASYEHTYRLPTATEVFGNGLFVTANADLEPEQSDNLNCGATYDFSIGEAKQHKFNVGSNFIYREAKDLIFQVVTLSSPQTNFSNLAEIRTIGVESNVNYAWKDFFELSTNMTYQNSTDQAEFTYNDFSGYQENLNLGERLPNTPYLFGNANARFNFENIGLDDSKLQATYRYNFVEEFFLSWSRFGNRNTKAIIPQQSSHDLELNYSFQNNKYNLGIECRNFTDEILYDKFRLQKPGRAFYVKFRYAIN
ncbi:TonB-dependent receptor [Psychroflexus aestuariivivens]|uniref:TonB-dependent receptor n=1 Tax=Psychroflexus aestuariivivens TaxID=1795040 RepID=UPI001960F1EB|nr:TonB-dependent receptor [Psychroflexus aestuariivivens]